MGQSRIQKIVSPLRVVTKLEVEIDMAAWTANYGVAGASAIRPDVKQYIDNLVREHLNEMGVLAHAS